jgi:hypothetical protein
VVGASKGSHNRIESCIQDIYRHRAADIVNDILAISGALPAEISGYDVGDKGKNLLEDFCSISVARSLRIGL